MKKILISLASLAVISATSVFAQEATPTPGYENNSAVDGYHIGFGGSAGVIGDESLI
jgi:hypothetical protein